MTALSKKPAAIRVVLPFVFVSIIPAWRAAIVDPDRAMRGIE